MSSSETLEEKIARVLAEEIHVSDYNPCWIDCFEEEKALLLRILPESLIIRIEHFGSTAVPGLCAKPIIDIVIEISNVELGKKIIPEALEPLGYDCFWRPLGNVNKPPYFTWCIGRHPGGDRKCHLHFVEKGFKENELRFRDILREHPQHAQQYGVLKRQLACKHQNDRIAYVEGKGDFIQSILGQYK